MKFRLHKLALAACASMLLVGGTGGITLAARPAQTPPNGPTIAEDFDGAFTNDAYCQNATCHKPESWGVWFIPHREGDAPGINFEPKFAQVKAQASRVKQGSSALKQSTDNATHTGGIYRIVNDVKPGSKVRFTVWGQVYSTNDDSPISTRPSSDIKLKVGLDPLGGNNGKASPLNGQVVWSNEQDAKDKFVQFVVETEAKSPTVIAYTYATMKDPVKHNEVFWDDAKIEIMPPLVAAPLGAGGALSQTVVQNLRAATETVSLATPQAVAAAPAQPAASANSQPASSAAVVKHKVKAGDTLFGIALQYGTTVDAILKLNNLQSDLLSIDQELIVKGPAPAPASPAPAAATPAPVAQAKGDAPALVGPGKACVVAYFDMNGNGKRDAGEDLVPNVAFSLSAGSSVLSSYTSDGVNEPHCFNVEKSGNFIAQAIAPPNYNPTTPMNNTVVVPAGGETRFEIGLRRVSDGTKVISVTPAPAQTAPDPQANATLVGVLAAAAGVGLIAAAGVITARMVARRRHL